MAVLSRGTLRRHTPCAAGMKAGVLDIPGVAHRLAVVHAELLLIHPFRDGNGRLARWLADLMALQAGLPAPAYRFTGRGGRARQEGYLKAVKRGYAADYALLTAFFAEALTRAVAAAR